MKYSSQGKWLILDIFSSPLEESLDRSNRWYKLANALPWDKMVSEPCRTIERIYNSTLRNEHNGAGNKSARMIVGALIIKHQLSLSDIETIEQIKENPYFQYFVGLREFSNITLFDPSLFVSIRKRLGIENINEITRLLMEVMSGKEAESKQSNRIDVSPANKYAGVDDEPQTGNDADKEVIADGESFTDESGRLHAGRLIIDATCCDAEVKYPTDLDVLNDAIEVSARVLKRLCAKTGNPAPRTFEKAARSRFLEVVKKKRKSKSPVRKGINRQLVYLRRHIDLLVSFVARNSTSCIKLLKRRDQQFISTCIKVYHQQKGMYDQKVHQCPDRIVSVFQPHVRPMVRGKSKAKVEFGSKIGVSVVKGYTFLDRFSWDAYNESTDLKDHVAKYVERFGCLPVKCYADKIYMNRENRKWLKDHAIHAAGKPLGRPTKEMQTEEYKQQSIRDKGIRNGVEATFGTGKRVYHANDIRAKLPDTGDTWTAMCFLVKNIKKFLKDFLFGLLRILEVFANKLNRRYALFRNRCYSLSDISSMTKILNDYLRIIPTGFVPDTN